MATTPGPDPAAAPSLDPAEETPDRGPDPAAEGTRGRGLAEGGTRGPDPAAEAEEGTLRARDATKNRGRDLDPETAGGPETTIKIRRTGPDLGTARAEIGPRIARAETVLATVPGLAPVPGTNNEFSLSTVLVKVIQPLHYFSPERIRVDKT